MRRRRHTDAGTDAVGRLRRAGNDALPDVRDLAPVHLHAIEMAVSCRPADARGRRAGIRAVPARRRMAFAMAAAAVAAVPSMAFAGVLPDRVQRAASAAAAVVGVDLPRPLDAGAGGERRDPAVAERPAEPATERRQAETGRGLGASTRGTMPGKPADGELRGNRYGQVEAGPDKGRANAAPRAGARPSTTATVPPRQKQTNPAGRAPSRRPSAQPIANVVQPAAPAAARPDAERAASAAGEARGRGRGGSNVS